MKISDKIRGYILVGLLCSGITAGTMWYTLDYSRRDIINTGEKYNIFEECRNIISKDGSKNFDNDKAFLGAINGYLQKGGDKYTYYYKDENTNDVLVIKNYVNSSGTALASGFQIDCNEDGYIKFTEIKSGLAANKQGIKAGDLVIEINGENVKSVGFKNIANKLLGKQDTTVKLKILRNSEFINIDFKRDNKYIRDVDWKKMNNGICYIQIKQFERFAAGYMSEAMEEIGDSNCFIIDLRNNPGGMVDVAVESVDWLAKKGSATFFNYNGKQDSYSTTSDDKDIKKPVVLLTNEETASAAEIFTAFAKQYGYDVTIVGTKTYGKGIFQNEHNLSDGGVLHYTAGYYTVGNWECYQGKGIVPDVEVNMDSSLIGTDKDTQLQKAIDLLENK